MGSMMIPIQSKLKGHRMIGKGHIEFRGSLPLATSPVLLAPPIMSPCAIGAYIPCVKFVCTGQRRDSP